jgi:hypothetical protein
MPPRIKLSIKSPAIDNSLLHWLWLTGGEGRFLFDIDQRFPTIILNNHGKITGTETRMSGQSRNLNS